MLRNLLGIPDWSFRGGFHLRMEETNVEMLGTGEPYLTKIKSDNLRLATASVT